MVLFPLIILHKPSVLLQQQHPCPPRYSLDEHRYRIYHVLRDTSLKIPRPYFQALRSPIFCPLPALHDILCLVGGPIINNKPHKIFAALAAEALIAPMQAVRPVIGWGEYCNGRHILPTFELLHSPCTRGTGPDIPRAGPLHTAAALFDSQHCNAEATAFPASPAPVRAPPAR